MSICKSCRDGIHQHDRWTGQMPGTRAGDDAGCPNQGKPGDTNSECSCKVVLAPKSSKGRRHCETCRCSQ